MRVLLALHSRSLSSSYLESRMAYSCALLRRRVHLRFSPEMADGLRFRSPRGSSAAADATGDGESSAVDGAGAVHTCSGGCDCFIASHKMLCCTLCKPSKGKHHSPFCRREQVPHLDGSDAADLARASESERPTPLRQLQRRLARDGGREPKGRSHYTPPRPILALKNIVLRKRRLATRELADEVDQWGSSHGSCLEGKRLLAVGAGPLRLHWLLLMSPRSSPAWQAVGQLFVSILGGKFRTPRACTLHIGSHLAFGSSRRRDAPALLNRDRALLWTDVIAEFDGNEARTSTATSATVRWEREDHVFAVYDPSADLRLFLFDDNIVHNERPIGRDVSRPPLRRPAHSPLT
jgi:hypothetical protein